MNEVYNPHGISLLTRYILAGAVGFTAFYAFLLIYFKMDRTFMEQERKMPWNEIQQVFQDKIGNHQNGEKE